MVPRETRAASSVVGFSATDGGFVLIVTGVERRTNGRFFLVGGSMMRFSASNS